MSRSLLAAVVLLSSSVFAQAISGTATTAFEGFNMYGVPQTRLTVNLSCSLTCPSSAPTLHFGSIVDAWLVADPMTKTGYVSAFFGSDPNGQNSVLSEQFDPGTAFFIIAKSSTCWCGGRTGEGGYIDIKSNNTAIPPWPVAISLNQNSSSSSVIVNAKPVAGETVELQLEGAGVSATKTWVAADFSSQGAVSYFFTPPGSGTLTITTRLQPYGATYTTTAEVKPAASSGTGGGSGGGSSATGGGSGGGGDTANPGCSTTGLSLVALCLGFLVRRRA